ncbi:metabotropic glutamate receptor 3 isoform X2 [Macrobrachium rosenbergii]|uniref:metabotropic glutamate receptor 3 isoform X2 n=1 Tax=Macrobrachium rosenbergii TaxID=79674 RepID=UPI0034D7B7E8
MKITAPRWWALWASTLLLSPAGSSALWGWSEESSCQMQRSFPPEPSDVYITGLVGVHGGGRCGLVDPAGVQMMEAARWTASKLGQVEFIPGTTVGVTTYDTCGGDDAVLRAGIAGMVQGGYLDETQCNIHPHVGVLHTHPENEQLASFLEDLDVPSVGVTSADLTPQLEALMPLLLRLNWTSVVVAAPSVKVLKQFGHLAARYRICVGAEAILPYTTSDQKVYRSVLEILETGETGGAVLIGPQDRLHAALSAAAVFNNTSFDWVLAPTGPIQEDVFQGLNSVASGVLALRRASQSVPEFGEHFKNVASLDPTLYPYFDPEDYVEEPAVFQVVEGVFKMGAGIRRSVEEHCGGNGWCANATLSLSDPETDGLDVIEALSIKSQRPRYQILLLSPDESTRLTFTKVGFYSAGILELDEAAKGKADWPSPHPCIGCHCLNVRFWFFLDLRWRTDAWVTICATMSIIGVLVAIAIMIYIMIQGCRGRTPEGSQAFSVLLLISCVFLYASILPYSFEASSIICTLRPVITSMSYALVFAVMLSRSLMLATADSEGLVGHVSGLVQSALLFFMVCVQAGLGVQQFLMDPPQFMHTPPPLAGGILYTCSGDRLFFLISHSYVMFLLFLLLLVSPFIIRSRRNYHEGLLFFIATILVVGIWVAWATLYMLMPPIWSDACICLGLAATPTCLLLCIFVPKTYLMVRAAAREALTATPIRALSRPHSAHDLARASSLALYDSISHLPEMTYSQLHPPVHAYTPDPTVHFPQKENPYEMYSHYQPSPHKVTQF